MKKNIEKFSYGVDWLQTNKQTNKQANIYDTLFVDYEVIEDVCRCFRYYRIDGKPNGLMECRSGCW